ncbi:MAG TPA: NAD(P)/FAD-dependent oxidoreductase [Chryseolinea sp.]
MAEQYDIVIIGSGLGGLACGTILAREGYKVCILEKNKQIGGNLQTYVRDRVIFDSGVHYVGGLDKGQNLYQLFKYLGIMDKLKLRKMDEDVFDAIVFEGDPVVYKYAQGYENFIKTLAREFPGEEQSIRNYCAAIKEVCSKFPLYNLKSGGGLFEKMTALEMDTKTFIESVTPNKKLQNVLAGNNLLYAGAPYKTPFYVHALIVNSYIESSYRFINGGSQISKYLSRAIHAHGGKILKHVKVAKIQEEGGVVVYAETDKGARYYGKTFISNIHPSQTLDMIESSMIKKAYRNRIKSLENSISTFYANVVMQKNSFKHLNHNYYYFEKEDPWAVLNYTQENWPLGFALFFTTSAPDEEYTEGVTVMAYMRFEDVKKWENTFNTVSNEASRGEDYEAFKKEKAEILFDIVERQFPGFKSKIKSYTTATPLSARDYIGTDDGSLYGLTKDYRDPLKSFISPRTKIPNLLLTGQNLNLHGVLGVTVSAVLTSSQILGMDYLIEKIHNAQENG